ncbi:MAG: cytochrome b/b6 domain-containing protein [Sulfurimonas sp.]|nr:cytochrome b/b6 domain-containing protein [Sulfurimonas sp.]
MSNPVYIWSKVTRYFHWILVVCIAVTFASSYFENAFLIHISFGIIAGGLLTFRLFWGFVGPFYAQFKNFNFSFKDLFYYFTNLFKDKKIYVGHNPAASWATILLIVFAFFCTVSGVILLGSQEDRGIFAFFPSSMTPLALQVHIISKNIVGIIAIVHIIGALLEHFWHKSDTVTSMIHGYKNIDAKPTQVTKWQNYLGVSAIVFSLFVGLFSYFLPQVSIMTKNYHEVEYAKENPTFAKECSECHNLYSPTFMTKAMWEIALDDEKKHFKKDLEEDVPHFKSIKEYILKNSAETSDTEISVGIIKSTKGKVKYRVTKTRYWRDIHKQIPRSAYKHPFIKSKSNCKACHKHFGRTNYINDEDISLEYFSNKEAIKIYL